MIEIVKLFFFLVKILNSCSIQLNVSGVCYMFVFLSSYSTVLIDFDCQSAQLGTFVILVCYSVLSDVGPAFNSSFYN